MILRFIISIALFISFFRLEVGAQEINFGQYGNYTLTISELVNEDLSFGPLQNNSGFQYIDLTNAKVVTLTGVRYLDVIVEITGQNALYLNGNPGYAGDIQRSIPLTLEASYANKGQNNIGQSNMINVVNNSAVVRFPILTRQNQPPGPPPTPPTGAFNQAAVEETAYLYLYGSINVGDVNAGTYSSTIEISITYD